MFSDFNDLPLGKDFQMFVNRSLTDACPVADGFDAGPAVAFASRAADEIGIDGELNWCHGNIEDRFLYTSGQWRYGI